MNATVKDVMSTHVIAVRQDAPFKEMAARLHEQRVSAFPVIDDDNKVIGVVSEADRLTKEALEGTVPRTPQSLPRQPRAAGRRPCPVRVVARQGRIDTARPQTQPQDLDGGGRHPGDPRRAAAGPPGPRLARLGLVLILRRDGSFLRIGGILGDRLVVAWPVRGEHVVEQWGDRAGLEGGALP